MRALFAAALFVGVIASAAPAAAQSVEEGARRFATSCARCHGPSHPENNLTTRVTFGFNTFERRLRTPLEGMPRFLEADLSDAEACSIFLYIRAQRPGVAPDPVDICGLTPPAPLPPPPPASSGEAVLPPEPPIAAIDERAFLFATASADSFLIDCWGGGFTTIRAEPYTGARWTYEVLIRKHQERVRLGGGAIIPWRPGECVRIGEPVPRGANDVFYLLRWRTLDRTPFVSYRLNFRDDKPSSVFTTGGTQTDMSLVLNALASSRHRIRLRVSPAERMPMTARSGLTVDSVQMVDVNGFAIATRP